MFQKRIVSAETIRGNTVYVDIFHDFLAVFLFLCIGAYEIEFYLFFHPQG